MRLFWTKWKFYEQNMEEWALSNTLLQLTQLRDRALDLSRKDEAKRYDLLIATAQQEILKAKNAQS